MSCGKTAASARLFDAHCHLQDPRISTVAPQLIRTALDSGVLRFAVNGVSERDWHLVKEMSDQYPCIIPNFGLHPWYVEERSPTWLTQLREFLEATPSAAVGEIGLDKGSHGKEIDFMSQVQVFREQLELAKKIERPVSVHCVRAFGDLHEILQCTGPFPAGLILHSYMGSAEMVTTMAQFGAYFSFSGYLTSMKLQKAKKMLKSVPNDRILLESDSPDGLPKMNMSSLRWVPGDVSASQGLQDEPGISTAESDTATLPKETLNHPANICSILSYVAMLLDMPEEELAELSYRNAMRLFSFPGSKISGEC